jgi:hypothetical protein
MMPGEAALTRMPREACSMASDLVAVARPPLVSAAGTDGALEFASSAWVALTLTTWPPFRFSISAMTRWVSQKNPVRLTPANERVVLRRVVGERLGDEDAGVVDQGVDAPEARQRVAGDPVRGGGLGDVSLDGEHVRVLRRLDRAGVGHHRQPSRRCPATRPAPVP